MLLFIHSTHCPHESMHCVWLYGLTHRMESMISIMSKLLSVLVIIEVSSLSNLKRGHGGRWSNRGFLRQDLGRCQSPKSPSLMFACAFRDRSCFSDVTYLWQSVSWLMEADWQLWSPNAKKWIALNLLTKLSRTEFLSYYQSIENNNN